jgi:chloramphenicol 3-O-phosphotransferase
VLDALGADRRLVVCLQASPDTVASRIAEREPDRWPGKQRLVDHARELALAIPQIQPIDLRIETDDREPDDVAAEIENALIALMQD